MCFFQSREPRFHQSVPDFFSMVFFTEADACSLAVLLFQSRLYQTFSLILVRRELMPCRRFFMMCKHPFDSLQYCFYKMKPQISKYKHNHKKQQKCSDFSNKHFSHHFVAKRFIKKSVKAANSSSCDT